MDMGLRRGSWELSWALGPPAFGAEANLLSLSFLAWCSWTQGLDRAGAGDHGQGRHGPRPPKWQLDRAEKWLGAAEMRIQIRITWSDPGAVCFCVTVIYHLPPSTSSSVKWEYSL